MDWVNIREKAVHAFQKYKFVLLIVGIGLFLMTLPEEKKEVSEASVPQAAQEEQTVAEALEEILAKIDGVGKVSVMLTEEAGTETLYQTDIDASSSDTNSSQRSETVIISDADRAENGLVRQINPPRYRGAIVVCQGADRPSVQLAVVEAVANVTGISAARITVLIMK